jgi:hypothetical protein
MICQPSRGQSQQMATLFLMIGLPGAGKRRGRRSSRPSTGCCPRLQMACRPAGVAVRPLADICGPMAFQSCRTSPV